MFIFFILGSYSECLFRETCAFYAIAQGCCFATGVITVPDPPILKGDISGSEVPNHPRIESMLRESCALG
jgi:hypothetical protein